MTSSARKWPRSAEHDEMATARRVMWHAHHWPDDYERCVQIGGRPVCRRCFVLYPLTFAIALLALAGVLFWPRSLDPLLIYVLSIPGTAEYVAEQLGWLRYSARRQIIGTIMVAIPLGRGFSYELDQRWSWYFWGPLFTFGTIWYLSAIVGKRRRERSEVPGRSVHSTAMD